MTLLENSILKNAKSGKGKCPGCHRPVQATVYDTCLYCGASLPVHQRYSEQEKQAIQLSFKHREETLAIRSEADKLFNKLRENNNRRVDWTDLML